LPVAFGQLCNKLSGNLLTDCQERQICLEHREQWAIVISRHCVHTLGGSVTARLTFVVADDHPLFRGAIKETLRSIDADVRILEAGDFETAKKIVAETPDVDLVLLDLTMPGASGLSGLVTLRAMQAAVPVVIVSASDDAATIRRALELGASGYIKKSSGIEEIRSGINMVLSGGIVTPANMDLGSESDPEIFDLIKRIRTLTPQQARVLGMLGEGLLNKQIAYELGVSEATIKAHVSAVLQKLNVDNRTQAVIRLGKIGIELPPSSV
jgi:DNA-binding NarL/FixJ family response regulator